MPVITDLKQAIIQNISVMEDEQKLQVLNAMVKSMSKQASQQLLTSAQKTMLEMALADAAAGRLISTETLQELDEAWLREG
ncbi:MAG: hypothetical protein Q8J69_03400 [Sphingobacteriaceae bacterium]|nr:hypothetical protein [Sphingobacteriaceae bacterium]